MYFDKVPLDEEFAEELAGAALDAEDGVGSDGSEIDDAVVQAGVHAYFDDFFAFLAREEGCGFCFGILLAFGRERFFFTFGSLGVFNPEW